MPLKRDPSKALQIGFLVLLLISTVQVGYWMYDHVQSARAVERRFVTEYRNDAAALSALDPVDAARAAALLPHLAVDGARVDVRPAALEELADTRAGRINQFLWEGGFFLAVLFGGMAVLTRTIRHDAELRRRQQNFLAAVSHEFKSPLASIQLASETLVLRSKEGDTQRLGGRIVEDVQRLLRMVDNLLDTTRLEEGRQRLAPAPTSLHGAAETAAAEVAERARLSNVALTIDVPQDLVFTVDAAALGTVLRNLLDNALKACVAGNGHAITVRGRRASGAVELAVVDDGLGFPPEEGAMIFEKFHRLGDELRRSMPGTGLGLYIVKRLVELGGGSVSAHSDGPGRGATITIVWPEVAR
ncbi:MAG TPA: HAMP domain-containing sensor histidine kinase [Gammaproteobacteria bacterium]|nr:HAMP domain-containing sensor histidine kinase [Gammaproteobacteria bacterium]